MSTKPMKPLANGKQQVQVDLSKADTVKCEKCGKHEFSDPVSSWKLIQKQWFSIKYSDVKIIENLMKN